SVFGALVRDSLAGRNGRAGRRHLQVVYFHPTVQCSPVLRVCRLRAAAGWLDGNPILLFQPFGQVGVLTREIVRYVMGVRSSIFSKGRGDAVFEAHNGGRVVDIRRRFYVRLFHVDGVVYDLTYG